MKRLFILFSFLLFTSITYSQVSVVSYAQPSGSSYTAEYQVILDTIEGRSGTIPLGDTLGFQDTFVDSLITYPIGDPFWGRSDIIYVAAQTANGVGEAQLNWLNPGTFDLTDPRSTAPAWTRLEGFTGDGASDYLSTEYVPYSDSINISRGSTSIIVYERLDYNENTVLAGVEGGADGLLMKPRNSNNQSSKVNASGSNTNAVGGSQGTHVAVRRGVAEIEDYYNGSSIGTDTDAVGGLPQSDTLIVLASNNDTVQELFSNGQLSVFILIDALSLAEVAQITRFIVAYMTAIGKEV